MRPQTDESITLRWSMKDAPLHRLRRISVSAMYPLFVATVVVLAARTHHRVVRAGGMQLKHRSKTPVPSASRRAEHSSTN